MLANECLILAVFGSAARLGARLAANDFPSKSLKRGDLSLARHSHTSWTAFRDNVLAPGQQSQPVRGIAVSQADALRGLIAEINSSTTQKLLRSVCVLDKVEIGDHVGHAALQFCAEQVGLQEKEKSVVRAQIQTELAKTFSEVRAISSCYAQASQEGY